MNDQLLLRTLRSSSRLSNMTGIISLLLIILLAVVVITMAVRYGGNRSGFNEGRARQQTFHVPE